MFIAEFGAAVCDPRLTHSMRQLRPSGPQLCGCIPAICVAIQAALPAEMIARAEAALRESKFLEFRLDSLDRPDAVLTTLRRFLAENKNVTAIATCRRKPNGGNFSGTLVEELQDPAQGRARRLPHRGS